jgi:hypothetical protein
MRSRPSSLPSGRTEVKVSLALDVEPATAPWIAQPTRIGAAILVAPEGGPAVDRDWLELLAELVAHPSTAMPCERIARMLCATFARTVHKHLERIYGKLGVNDRLAAVLEARRLGLVTS